MKNAELDDELNRIAQIESEARALRVRASEERTQADEKLRHALENLDQQLKDHETDRLNRSRR
ncbi:MAG: hypothetical protein HC769_18925 [Cyanobacteria bacterium CRU_2_1]|nr:hypothetical protein [Cyanobacteria bacterium CRU_2_1]